jgi:hypothetical protein
MCVLSGFFFFFFFFSFVCNVHYTSSSSSLSPSTEINFVRDCLGKVVSVQAHFQHIERRPRRRKQRNADLNMVEFEFDWLVT